MTLINTGGGGGVASVFDRGPTVLNPEDDHFDTNTLDPKWTILANTMGGSYDVNTSVSSALVTHATASGQAFRMEQTVSHTGNVSYVGLLAGSPNANYSDGIIKLWNSAGHTDGVMVEWKYTNGMKIAMSRYVSGTPTFDYVTYSPPLASRMAILIQRKSNVFQVGVGQHPGAFYPLGTSLSQTRGTITRVEIELNNSGNVFPWALDCVLRDYVYLP
jgi:hypothetical protein